MGIPKGAEPPGPGIGGGASGGPLTDTVGLHSEGEVDLGGEEVFGGIPARPVVALEGSWIAFNVPGAQEKEREVWGLRRVCGHGAKWVSG